LPERRFKFRCPCQLYHTLNRNPVGEMEMDKLVFIGGLLVLIDAVGSILLPGNTHRFWYNAERVARGILAIGLMYYAWKYLK
jgi:hypothetical protein